MNTKRIIISAAVIGVAGLFVFLGTEKFSHRNSTDLINADKKQKVTLIPHNEVKVDEKVQLNENKKSFNAGIEKVNNISSDDKYATKTNLYNDVPSSVMPLSVISEIQELPADLRNTISDISKNYNIYMLQKNKNKLLIISDNPENIRHSIEFTEINISNGHQIKTTLGYNDKMQDTKNDIWEYDSETNQPVRHTKYDSNGDMEFVEVWSYDSENPVKYEMKDSNGNLISMRKETLNNGTDLRVEHLLYDKDGHTQITVTATYDGDDIKRFTYYNADKIDESGSIFSDYSDGQKIKETVYTSDLKVKNIYTSDYKDGDREDIIKWDNKNQEVKKYIPEDNL